MKQMIESGRLTVREYDNLHYWVKKQLGKPSECENCGDTDRSRYEWANISGEYLRDITDWARLCRSCHTLIDGVRPQQQAHAAFKATMKARRSAKAKAKRMAAMEGKEVVL